MTPATIQRAAALAPPVGTTGSGNKELGKEEFLRLLVTQLRHQDPLSPANPEQFASQLAQFSSLERMVNIEKILQDQMDASSLSTLALKADLGASFIGRQVLAAGNRFEVAAGESPSVSVDIGTGGGQAVLTIRDMDGNEVTTRALGFREGGRQTFNVGELPAGSYRYDVTVTSVTGADVPVQTYTQGVVDGVSFQGGTVILRSGTLNFPLDNVVEVERAPVGAAALAAVTSARILPSSAEPVLP